MEDIKAVLAKLDKKIDKLDSRLDHVDITLIKQEAQLAEHIRRTNILEQKLEPVEKHVTMVNGVLKFIGLLAVIAGIWQAVKS